MEDFNMPDIEFEDKSLNDCIEILKQAFKNKQDGFAMLCYGVYKCCKWFDENYSIRDKSLRLYTKYEFLEKFGFDERRVRRLCDCCKRFTYDSESTGDIARILLPVFFGYSPSKLFELLPLSNEQIYKAIEDGLLQPSMTVKQIREYVKSVKGKSTKQAVYEDNEPEEDESVYTSHKFDKMEQFSVYNTYNVDFFSNLDKLDLITICQFYQAVFVEKNPYSIKLNKENREKYPVDLVD